MAAKPQLDAAGSSRKGFVIFFLAAVLALRFPAFAQDSASDQARLPAAQSAFDAGHWEEAAKLARGPADQSPDFDFLAGLALAHLEKWDEAKLAFDAGFRKAPGENPRQTRVWPDRKSTRLNSSHQIISYAVFCLKKKNNTNYKNE